MLRTKQKFKGRSRKENDVSRGGAGQEDDVTREGETSSIGCPGHTSEANISAVNVRWSLMCRKNVCREFELLMANLLCFWCFASYRQLQSTHPEQDDTRIRQLATNIEVQVCQKAKLRVRTVLC